MVRQIATVQNKTANLGMRLVLASFRYGGPFAGRGILHASHSCYRVPARHKYSESMKAVIATAVRSGPRCPAASIGRGAPSSHKRKTARRITSPSGRHDRIFLLVQVLHHRLVEGEMRLENALGTPTSSLNRSQTDPTTRWRQPLRDRLRQDALRRADLLDDIAR